MNNNKGSQILAAAWKQSESMIAKEETFLTDVNLDQLIGQFFCPGPFYYYIFDFYEHKFSFMSPLVKGILDFDPDNVTPNDIIRCIHPDDIPHMANCERTVFNFIFTQIPQKKRSLYKVSYCIRIKTLEGNYRLFLHQSIALTTDQEGGIGKTLCVHTDISHLTNKNNYKVAIIGLDNEPSFLDIDPSKIHDAIKVSKHPFSSREITIIRLLAEGLSTNDIATKLILSSDTIKSHRKNIMSKMGCKNTVELISRSIKEGLI